MLRIVIIVLFVRLGVCQDVLADSNSCLIPDVQNGEIGQFQTRSNRSYEEFKKFPAGQHSNENETLYLRCQNGYFPTENSVIYSNNRFEIRCNGGMWSKLLQCKAAPCIGDPPKMNNGYPVIHNREHGYVISYMCDNNDTEVKSDVKCHFGSWIGNAPKCLEEVRCEEPEAPEHGSVRLSDDPKAGSLATYSCDPGKKLYGQVIIKCLITGQWTFDPPKCVGFCNVPDVKNGEMGRIESLSRFSFGVTGFMKFSTGSQIDHNEMLLLRCDEGFIPTDGSTIFENNQLEVTCVDGTWSKNVSCKETSCFEEPPPVRNGRPVIESPKHGQSIWYVCDSRKYTRQPGLIKCHFGTWTGSTPRCLYRPCHINALNYSGLEKPWQAIFDSYESFTVTCKKGFKKTTLNSIITCVEGKWSAMEDPCIEVSEEDNESSGHPIEECTCTYVYSSCSVIARAGNKVLQEGDSVRKGVTVSFECKADNRVLSWDNGLRLYEKVNMTCSRCQKWERKDVPYCKFHQEGHPLIVYNNKLKILPGGVAEIKTGEIARLHCISTSDYPIWYFNGNPVGYQIGYTSDRLFEAYMDLIGTNWSTGKYDCLVRHGSINESTSLDLRVTVTICSIQDLAISVPKGVVPDMTGVTVEFMPLDTEMRLECENNLIPNGNSKAVCRNNGKWELGSFQCIPGCTLEIEPSSHLVIQPMKDGYRLGEFILLSCPPGEAMTTDVERLMCLGKTWSDIIPDCKEQE